MEKKTFEELICNPGLLNKETLSEIEMLLKEYPFCQTFHLLYAKNLSLQNHIRFHQQLKLAAAIVGDRSRLKHYIEDSESTINAASDNLYQGEVKLDESNIESLDNNIDASRQSEPIEIIQASQILKSDFPIQPLTALQANIYPVQKDEEQPGSDKPVDWDADSETMLLSALDAKMSREEKKKAIIALINKKFSERINTSNDLKPEIETAGNEIVDDLEYKSEIFSEVKEDQNEDRIAMADSPEVLMVDSYPVSDLTLSEDFESKEKEQLESDSVNEVLTSTNNESPRSSNAGAISSEVLIDRFIRNAPRISRPRKEFYNPVNLAARSVEENEGFYTETYASICLHQGNAPKAIKIYEKLSLKVPEKSSYFAGLIEKIKKEHNI